jgi:hypothetical protein
MSPTPQAKKRTGAILLLNILLGILIVLSMIAVLLVEAATLMPQSAKILVGQPLYCTCSGCGNS